MMKNFRVLTLAAVAALTIGTTTLAMPAPAKADTQTDAAVAAFAGALLGTLIEGANQTSYGAPAYAYAPPPDAQPAYAPPAPHYDRHVPRHDDRGNPHTQGRWPDGR